MRITSPVLVYLASRVASNLHVRAGFIPEIHVPPVRPPYLPPRPIPGDGPLEGSPRVDGGSDTDPSLEVSPRLAGSTDSDPSLQYAPASEANSCLKQGGQQCAEVVQNGAKVASKILDVASHVEDALSSSTAASSSASGSVTLGSWNVSASVTSQSSTPTPIPFLNVATGIPLSQEQIAVFNQEEQHMFFHDNLCFWANIERQYINAASPVTTTTDSTQTSPSSMLRRQYTGTSLTSVLATTTVSPSTPPTPLDSAAAQSVQSDLFLTYLPSQILNIYAPASVTNASESLTTSVTTCSGLDGAPAFTTPYAIKITSATDDSTARPTGRNPSAGAAGGRARVEWEVAIGAFLLCVGCLA